MKKNLLTLQFVFSLGLGLVLFAGRLNAAESNAVEQWGVFEVTLKGPADGNPFTDVTLSAKFTQGSRTMTVAGFYDG